MTRARFLAFTGLLGLLFGGAAHAGDILRVDFERSDRPADYTQVKAAKVEATIESAGPGKTGRYLHLATRQPQGDCALSLAGPIRLERNLVLGLDYKTKVEPGYELAYLGIVINAGGKQLFFTSEPPSADWRSAAVPLAARMARSNKTHAEPGMELAEIRIYARVKEKTAVKGETKARLELSVDNLRLFTGVVGTAEFKERESFSNPPFLNWPRGDGSTRLEWSRDPSFAPTTTKSLEVAWNFYTPPAPLTPGTWYWRAWRKTPLADACVAAERLNLLPAAHRFQTAPVALDQLARRPRPRLLALAKLDQTPVTEKRKAELVKSARKIYQQGVPEHPGPHVPGDPRWPTWIDWYGKVAGRVTGGTGRRLQTLGQYAMLTSDPEVIGWAKQLALEAAKWDPEGGSAMRRGDIGAHHLLRGLSWCYDAARDQMTPAERETLLKVIVARAEQFHGSLNPSRHGEANNHAWLRALGLGEAGLVLAGDHPDAGMWAEFSRQLYLGRFLCILGFQGDNNEGIGYWSYGLGFVIDYADLLRSVCGIDLYRHPWLNQTARFPMYCAPPNAWAVSFADTGMPNHGVRGPAMTNHVRKLALRTADPYTLWYSGERQPVDGVTPKAPTDLPQSIHYRHIGVVIFNTSLTDGLEGSTVALHSGRYWAGHQHPDQNHFVIHAYGEKLAIDGGYYDWYGSAHFKAYSMTTLAHNTLLVDGQGQAACKQGADGRILHYFDSPGYGYTVGDASNPMIYGGSVKRFERRLLFIKPGFVVVHDLVASPKPARFDWMLHGLAPIEIAPERQSFVIPAQNAALRGRFLAPAAPRLEVKTGFPVEPVNRYSTNPVPRDNYFPEWILYATPAKPAASEEFLAAMQIQRLGKSPEPAATIESAPAENGRGLKLMCGASTHWIVLRGEGAGPTRAGQLSTDGQLAAAEIAADNTVRRALAIQATYLDWNGVRLLKSPATADLSKGR